jgi:hypothetical protein
MPYKILSLFKQLRTDNLVPAPDPQQDSPT